MKENARHWARLDELFAAAVDLPAQRQASFVEQETAGDPELRAELQGLLEHDSRAKGRILEALQSAASPLEWTGRRLGPYRIVREIGRGGMGLVFEAVRDDDEYRKTVALKIAPWWRDLDLLRERFRQERQILAGLEHPNIARFLDGGTDHGIPYFAMEFVEGRRIIDYAAELKLREKIDLFREVCSAVQYAHQSLVVHRDLKPANILVTQEGIPKLLDFGIAKLLSPFEEDRTVTRISSWTPDYASPEQVRARPITTRTDVYSLGLILFEMFAGQRAQTADTSSPLALDRSICEMETPPASAKAPRTVARHLAGDLDTIIAKAIQKQPERRYASVAEFSDDLGRYLGGRPVLARKDNIGYRTRKFLLRNRAPVAVAVALAVSLVGGTSVALMQARRAEYERQLAERRFQQVRQLAGKFLLDFHDAIAGLPGSTAARKMVVETGLRYYDTLVQEAHGDRDLLEEIARGYDRLGDVQGRSTTASLRDSDGALESYQKARAIRQRISDPSPQFLSETIIGNTRIGQVQTERGDVQQAQSILRETIAQAQSGPNAGAYQVRQALGDAYRLYGDSFFSTASFEGAIEPYSNYLNLCADLALAHPNTIADQTCAGVAHMKLGRVYVNLNRNREALPHVHAAISSFQSLLKTEPDKNQHYRQLYNSYAVLVDALASDPALAAPGEQKRALELMVQLANRMAAADPNNRTALFDLMRAQADWGDWLRDHGQIPAAIVSYQKAVASIEKFAAASPPGLFAYDALVSAHQRLASGFAKSGQIDKTLQEIQKARENLAAMERITPNTPLTNSRQASLLATRAAAYEQTKGWRDAIASYAQAIDILDELRKRDLKSGSHLSQISKLLPHLADCYARAGQRSAAIATAQLSLNRFRELASVRPLTQQEETSRAAAQAKLAAWAIQ